ncbi:MAG: thiamine-phosphate kinase [Desulfuromonadales bacterium GWD2_61_12]|nr:MAG: thiamine-phosphate kinase [Desulfuromonadales bacterium GWC2_61_20]OGR36294.1 MAG: thiamine-phosphate kinase [Desulfuromonadales bacterium GWD2_61_12]HAD04615.1 thiamine-phosphate kinase [Desulfuromonas sp.]HBT82979.1 thiamine-phosphate kinase [Desulfuromonas sp.]
MKLAELGEFGFIARIRAAAPPGPGLRLGIGDDCAVSEVTAGELLLTTTDMLLEDVHFCRDWTSPRLLGRKCVAVNVSDIAAMGGTVRHLYLGLGIPADMAVAELDELLAGVLEAAADYGADLAGGDTCASSGPLVLSLTAEGTIADGDVVGRGGACPGDAVYVSGSLGDSALALRELRAGRRPSAFLASRHHDPTARAALGQRLAREHLATAMIDVSDGLLADLGHLLRASTCGARIDGAALPLSADFAAALAVEPGLFPLALSGGEDYELLFTVPPAAIASLARVAETETIPLSRIGTVVAGAQGVIVTDRNGGVVASPPSGHDHFRRGV